MELKDWFCILTNWICIFVNTCIILPIRFLRLWSWKTGFEFDQKVDLWSLKAAELWEILTYFLPSFFGPRKGASFLRNELILNKCENKNSDILKIWFWSVYLYERSKDNIFECCSLKLQNPLYILLLKEHQASQPLQTAVLYS